ncbi:ABC transporter substrate-binding protein [Rhodococcus triatomae]|nr:ABC transporter substrate-binding protein [Rhodococcus triatomae]
MPDSTGPESRMPVATRPRARALVAAGLTLAVAAVTATGCASAEEQVPTIGYGIDNVVTTYNAGTVDGATSGARQAFVRVQPGFSYTGPEGTAVSDTDVGSAHPVPAEALTIAYQINPAAEYSDGAPLTCDDLVLTWAAHSGRFTGPDGGQLFDAAEVAGYTDIDRVDCVPGAREATVVFRSGRSVVDWKSLFGATSILPSHVVEREAGVDDLVAAVEAGDVEALGRVAEFWNTGWSLVPGELDLSRFPSAGPYKLESYSEDDGLVLVANDRWWGNRPATERIVVRTKGEGLAERVESGEIEVLDVAEGSVPGLDVAGWEVAELPSLGVEQLILSSTGVFDSAAARRAFAACVPRDQLFETFGTIPEHTGAPLGVVDARFVARDDLIYPSVATAADGRYRQPDVAAASAAGPLTVRIGYRAPDQQRRDMVSAIASACEPAGITVEDAGSPEFTSSALRRGEVDAVLAGTAGADGSAGSTERTTAMYALRSGSGSNFGGFANSRVDQIVDQLAVDGSTSATLALAGEAENILWTEMPTIPLFNQPRTIGAAEGMHALDPNPSRSGTGWNMDRWVLRR